MATSTTSSFVLLLLVAQQRSCQSATALDEIVHVTARTMAAFVDTARLLGTIGVVERQPYASPWV
jgi:hypothetical protein